MSENLQKDCAELKLRVAELEAATEHLGLTPQQAKDGLSRHKALVAERDRLQSDKANLIQQAEIQAQEARTMKSIVSDILTDLDLPQKDYEARSSIAQKFSRLQSECDRLQKPRPFECWSNDDGDSWCDDPADVEFVDGLKVGDTFELLAGFNSKRVNYIVTKSPDDVSDDYEVEQVK